METMTYPKFKSRYSKKDNKIYILEFEPDYLFYIDTLDIDLSSYSSDEVDLLLNMPADRLISIAIEQINFDNGDDLPF